jgi:iron-sulfur cluster assembly protein
MSVTLSEKAAAEVKRVQRDQNLSEAFLRVGAASGGCSGLSYRLGFDTAFDSENDGQTECHGVKIVIDRKSAVLLEGTAIDYYDDGDSRGFTFDNPNVTRSCSAGGAFEV